MENSEAMYRRPTVPVPPLLPSISDYWPDAPHRIGPPADHYTDESTASEVDALRRSGTRGTVPESIGNGARETVPGSIGNGGRDHSWDDGVGGQQVRRGRRAALGTVLAAVLLGATGAVVTTLVRQADRTAGTESAAAPRPPVPSAAADPAVEAPRPNAIAAPVEGRELASFELVSDTTTIDLDTADLGADLYRITTPAAGSVLPRARNGDTTVRLFLDDNGRRGESAVKVLLNADVRWSLTIPGGMRTGVFDLGGAQVDTVDFAGGAARIDLTVPRPDGTLPIRMSGGVNRFEVHTGQGVPVRVRTRRGAGQVKLDGRTDRGVARGASFRSPDWAASRNRIDLDAVAGVGTLRVGRG